MDIFGLISDVGAPIAGSLVMGFFIFTVIKQILEGIPASATCIVNSNSDRRAAISDTLQSAHVGDIVIVAGKGHETTQEFAHHREEFDDVAVVHELLNLHIGKPA